MRNLFFTLNSRVIPKAPDSAATESGGTTQGSNLSVSDSFENSSTQSVNKVRESAIEKQNYTFSTPSYLKDLLGAV